MNAQPQPTAERRPVTLPRLRRMLADGEKITMLTAYDASFARLADDAGVDCLLVGDSLGMVVQGGSSTVPVTLDEVACHVRCVARGRHHANSQTQAPRCGCSNQRPPRWRSGSRSATPASS